MTAMTGAEYRHKGKLRVEKFKREQEKKGFKNMAVYLSERFRAELDRLKDEDGMTRQQAMEHVFAVYEKTVNKNITINKDLKSEDKGLINAVPEQFRGDAVLRDSLYLAQDPSPSAEDSESDTMSEPVETDHSVSTTDKPILGNVLELSDEEMEEAVKTFIEIAEENFLTDPPADEDGIAIPVNEEPHKPMDLQSLPDCHSRDITAEERHQFLLMVEKMFPGQRQGRNRADALNAAGITPGKAAKWTSKNVNDNLRLVKKRLRG